MDAETAEKACLEKTRRKISWSFRCCTEGDHNITKYADLPASCTFQPLAFETHGAIHFSALDFLNAVGGRFVAGWRDQRETTFFWQRMSVLMQRFNAILISETFDEAPDL